MVSDERKFSAPEVGGKMVHSPNGSLHLKEKRCVVAFVLLQLSAGISDDTVLTILVDLRKNGTKATRLFVIAKAGIDNKSVGSVSSWVVDDRLGAQICLKLLEGFESIRWQLATFPRTVFFR